MGCELQLPDDVRSAKAEKQQLLRVDGAAQQRERRGGENGRDEQSEYHKGRLECGLNDGLVFGDREIVGLRVREP